MVLLLGGDLGHPPRTFAAAERLIDERIGPVLARSRDHWTMPWGFTGEHLFLNRAVHVDTGDRSPRVTLQEALAIETALGRTRDPGQRYTSRIIDIDILFAEQVIIDEVGLRIPHSEVHRRAFALAPAADIVPDLMHPVLRRTVLQLLDEVLVHA
jgi:2-amino-4-hydroxy-6-hydroxymethyldihydropteridine diphosphokinase